MKRLLALMLSLLLLAGCAAVPSTSVQEPSSTAPQEAYFHCRVLYLLGDTLLLIPTDSDALGDLFTLGLADKPVFDAQGNPTEAVVKEGDLLTVTFDGSVQAIWPSILSGVSAVQITGHEETLVPFYTEKLLELFKEDEGLNHEIQRISLDLTGVQNLTDAEKTAVEYILWCKSGVEVFAETMAELKEQGFLGEDGMYYETGILLTMEDTALENGSFLLSAMKWRSGLGAIGYSDAKAENTANGWTCVPEAWFIS